MILKVPEGFAVERIDFRRSTGAVRAGEVLATYPADADAGHYVLLAQTAGRVEWCDQAAVDSGDEVIGSFLPPPGQFDMDFVALWMSAHAAVRGLQATEGQGGLTAAIASGIPATVTEGGGASQFIAALDGTSLENGDIVVLADKVAAIAQGRVAPRAVLRGLDPKFLPTRRRHDLAKAVSQASGVHVSALQMLLIDHLDDGRITLGTHHPNAFAAQMAEEILARRGVSVDVAISDSDTGVDRGRPVLGLPTVSASPLGGTAGLSLYELMRVTNAAEIVRGHTHGTPLARIQPAERNRERPAIGDPRHYPGVLTTALEPEMHRGLPTPAYWTMKP